MSRSHSRTRRLLAVASALVLAASLAACTGSDSDAASSGGTLQEVLKTKKLRVGVLDGVPPYGQYDAQHNFVGYDADVAQMLADNLGAELELVVLGDSAARISALVANTVDLSLGTFTMTPERATSVAFSLPLTRDPLVLLGHQGDNVSTYADLQGQTVAYPNGTTAAIIEELAPDNEFLAVADDPAALQAFRSGQAQFLVLNQLAAEELVEENPDYEIKGVLSSALYCIGTRLDDLVWLQWVNSAIIYAGMSGELQAIYLKWFKEPMPPTLPDF